MADKPTPKADQVAALRQARAARRHNPFEDAARGRDVAESSDGGVEGHAPLDGAKSAGSGRHGGVQAIKSAGDRQRVAAAGVEPGPSEAKPMRRGRPRIGEVREKPWLMAEPPMSERTWYRRQREQRK